MSKAYKIRTEESEALRETTIKMIIEKKVNLRESDVLHALLKKFLPELKSSDVIKYREEVLGKEE
jgi:hypothetical protein